MRAIIEFRRISDFGFRVSFGFRISDFVLLWDHTMTCFLFTLLLSAGADAAPAPLFDSDGYKRYRIPALVVTPKGTLLAICEGRVDGRGLTGNIDIVLKRSPDSGRTWEPLRVVADDAGNTLGNPCVVVDAKTGTLWMALTRSLGSDVEDAIVAGTSKETTRVLITRSVDDGLTWDRPRDITDAVKRPDWTWYGTGPGIGLQLSDGRLVIPSYHAEAGTKTYRSHMIFSDDAGKTWKRGEPVGTDVSECQVAQRLDGSLVLGSRTLKGEPRRTTAVSTDGGATWSKPTRDDALYDPSCQASLYRIPGEGKPRWLHCGPAGPGRRNLTVKVSLDEGRTWGAGTLLRSGDSQYCSLALLRDGSIGCLHESWTDGNYRVHFLRFDPARLSPPNN